VVVGVGNPIRMDDFVGVKIVRDLSGKVDSDRVILIEAETIPENHMQEIVDYKPTHILIIDAAITGQKPGETKLVNPDQLMNFPAYSTHILPLRLFTEYVAEATKAKIALLLIEPMRTNFGEGLTPSLEGAAVCLSHVLLDMLPK